MLVSKEGANNDIMELSDDGDKIIIVLVVHVLVVASGTNTKWHMSTYEHLATYDNTLCE